MGSFAWFQDGVGYGAKELATWNALLLQRGAFRHVFASTGEFAATANQGTRSLAVGAGSVLVGAETSGGTWAWSSGETLSVPAASNDNPRKDLVVARLVTADEDGVNGLAIELIQGTPAASPQVPDRPVGAVALYVLESPRATTTFTVTDVRVSADYQDQATQSNGSLAIDWAGVLPSAAAFPVGFTLYDYGTNQRWVRKADQTWFTSDPGPWRACTLQSVEASDGTIISVSGELWMREDSTRWEIAGNLTLSPSQDPKKLYVPATMPAGITRPKQNACAAIGQSWGSVQGGVGRLCLLTRGVVELGTTGSTPNIYVDVTLPKSPWHIG